MRAFVQKACQCQKYFILQIRQQRQFTSKPPQLFKQERVKSIIARAQLTQSREYSQYAEEEDTEPEKPIIATLHVNMLNDLKTIIPECYLKLLKLEYGSSKDQEESEDEEDEEEDEEEDDEEDYNAMSVSWNLDAIKQVININDLQVQRCLAYLGKKVIQFLIAEWTIAYYKPVMEKQIKKVFLNQIVESNNIIKCLPKIKGNKQVLKLLKDANEGQFSSKSQANVIFAAFGGLYLLRSGNLRELRFLRHRLLEFEISGSSHSHLLQAFVQPMDLNRFPRQVRAQDRISAAQSGISHQQANKLFRNSNLFDHLFGDYYLYPQRRKPVLILKALTCTIDQDTGCDSNRVMGWMGWQIFSLIDAELRVFQCLYQAMVSQFNYDPTSQDTKIQDLSQDIGKSLDLDEIMIGVGQKQRRSQQAAEMFGAIFTAMYIDGGCTLHECAEWLYTKVGRNMKYQESLQKRITNN